MRHYRATPAALSVGCATVRFLRYSHAVFPGFHGLFMYDHVASIGCTVSTGEAGACIQDEVRHVSLHVKQQLIVITAFDKLRLFGAGFDPPMPNNRT
ncbi:hypothetical protein PT974_01825 [Cladobotryum mycophilum]|uniref:Secreted protein n=1 Tax=Cladobotryum mycophilum TaxID=491253 RepID=A0ABR0SWC2_9HYPO